MITLLTPRYAHRKVSADEKAGRQITDAMDPSSAMPTKCNACGAAGTPAAPLMAKPFFRVDSGGPKGTLYQAWCWKCYMSSIRTGGF